MTYIVVAKNGRRLCIRRNLGNAIRVAARVGGRVFTPKGLEFTRATLVMTSAAMGASLASQIASQVVAQPWVDLRKRIEVAKAIATHSINTAQRMTAALTYGTPNARSLS